MEKKTRTEFGYTFEWHEGPLYQPLGPHWEVNPTENESLRIIPAQEGGDGKWHLYTSESHMEFEDKDTAERDVFNCALGYLLNRLINSERLAQRVSRVKGNEESVFETICVQLGRSPARFHITRISTRNLDKPEEWNTWIADSVTECKGDCQPTLTISELDQARNLISGLINQPLR